MKLNEHRVLFYDTESTGLNILADRIIEIAVYDPASPNDPFVSLINPEISIPQDSIMIHGITDDMVSNQPVFSEVFLNLKKYCGDKCYLIAHNNNKFDEPIMRAEAKRCNVEIPETWEFLDSKVWSTTYRSDLKSHSLQNLREYFGIEKNTAHRALDDTVILYKIFDIMTGDLTIDYIASKITILPENAIMPFGKHKGQLISKLPTRYINWLYEEGVIFSPENYKIKQTIEKLHLEPAHNSQQISFI